MENENLWEKAGNLCLDLAIKILSEETAPTAETVEAAQKLINMAISMDMLNLRWKTESRSYAAVRRGSALERTVKGN